MTLEIKCTLDWYPSDIHQEILFWTGAGHDNPAQFCVEELSTYRAVCTLWHKLADMHPLWQVAAEHLDIDTTAQLPGQTIGALVRSHLSSCFLSTPQGLLNRIHRCFETQPLGARHTLSCAFPKSQRMVTPEGPLTLLPLLRVEMEIDDLPQLQQRSATYERWYWFTRSDTPNLQLTPPPALCDPTQLVECSSNTTARMLGRGYLKTQEHLVWNSEQIPMSIKYTWSSIPDTWQTRETPGAETLHYHLTTMISQLCEQRISLWVHGVHEAKNPENALSPQDYLRARVCSLQGL